MSPAPKKPKKKPLDEEPGVLFIRNVPPKVLADLDAIIDELRARDELYSGLSRASLALKFIKEAIKAHRAASKSEAS